jgi:hypothetical protein
MDVAAAAHPQTTTNIHYHNVNYSQQQTRLLLLRMTFSISNNSNNVLLAPTMNRPLFFEMPWLDYHVPMVGYPYWVPCWPFLPDHQRVLSQKQHQQQ